ncbi:MAG: prepilin-type N-terminal cleavage/methylation domain-containing protein [bacterium]
MNRKGFTLVELLVVIVIIGILATLATVALGSARLKARDARRISDIKQIQTALELYYNDMQRYPTTAASNGEFEGGTDLADVAGTVVYMASVPEEATATLGDCDVAGFTYNGYRYWGTKADGTGDNASPVSYAIEYCLGGTTGDIAAGLHTASTAGIK